MPHVLRRSVAPLLALSVLALAGVPAASAAGSGSADDFRSGLDGLVARLSSDGVRPSSVHAAKASLIDATLADALGGVPAATVIKDMDCISVAIQRARSERRSVRTRMADA